MINCKCCVCGATWDYDDGTDESLIRASSAPCGHQGLFEMKRESETDKQDILVLVQDYGDAVADMYAYKMLGDMEKADIEIKRMRTILLKVAKEIKLLEEK